MSERLTNILGYLTLFAILGAVWVMFGEDPSREQGARGERTFVGLEARINDVATIEIQKGDLRTTIVKDKDVWRLKERAGYLVDSEKVRAMLRGIVFSKRREPKTANPDRFSRIGLGAKATKITLRDDTDGEILSFDMGRRKDTRSGKSLTYVWHDRDTRSWLVTEIAETPAQAGWWLRRPLLDIDQSRFSDVTIGGAWLTRKLSAPEFRLQGKRASETVAAAYILASPAQTVSHLGFEDVRHLTNPLEKASSVVDFTTYDGLSLKLSLYKIDGGVWVQVKAEFDMSLRNEGASGTLPAAPADGQAEADAINAAVRGWIFKLNETDARTLQQVRADFLQTSVQ